jgi:hypothetical protein
MIDFVPIQSYTPIYYYFMLIVVLFTFLHTQLLAMDSSFNRIYIRRVGVGVLILVLIYMGLRPVHGVFVDMTVYANIFERYKMGYPITSDKDVFFHVFTKFSATIMNAHLYFMVCTILYVVPLYIVCKRWFKEYWFYGFLFLIVSFSFWAYGVNGIRNGIAGSLFLLGVSRDKRIFQILWLLLAFAFHKSMLLPILGFVIVQFHNYPKSFILLWLLCIPLSIFSGAFWEQFFFEIGFEDDRFSYLIDEVDESKFSGTGFRWDFLFFSAIPVFAGWYYIFHRKYYDKIYYWLFNTYLFANAFWILVINANFSNRFAYLSWFIMALVICYPLLNKQFLKNQHLKLGWIMLAYFGFTFIMNVIL